MNLGNPEEVTILELARLIAETAEARERSSSFPRWKTILRYDALTSRSPGAGSDGDRRSPYERASLRTITWARDAGWGNG